MELQANKPFSKLLCEKGITNWKDACKYVQQLPYGRNNDRSDFTLVVKEQQGTCSSKHAFLQSVAMENNMHDCNLILGIYKMNASNTPGIGEVLTASNLPYIPEAHCYLMHDGERLDITNPVSNIQSLLPFILEEHSITPQQVVSYKVDYHKQYLSDWIDVNQIPYTFEALWSIREACIQALSSR